MYSSSLNERKTLISLISGDSKALSVFISKVLHDIASPLNTIMMGIGSLEDCSDTYIMSYVNESAEKMAAMLSIFRKLTQETDEMSPVSEIEKIISAFCKFSIRSDEELLPANTMQLLLCIMYSIIYSTPKIANISCNISSEKLFINVFTNDLFCSFDNCELSRKNVFPYLSVMIANSMEMRILVKKEEDHFFISCA